MLQKIFILVLGLIFLRGYSLAMRSLPKQTFDDSSAMSSSDIEEEDEKFMELEGQIKQLITNTNQREKPNKRASKNRWAVKGSAYKMNNDAEENRKYSYEFEK